MSGRMTMNLLCVASIIVLFGVMFLVWALASIIYMYNPIAGYFPSDLFHIIGFFLGLAAAMLFCFLVSLRLRA